MIYIKPKNVAAGEARRNIFWINYFVEAPNNIKPIVRLRPATLAVVYYS